MLYAHRGGKRMLRRWLSDASGATAIEYALIAGLIFAVAVVGISAVGDSNNGMYARIGRAFTDHVP